MDALMLDGNAVAGLLQEVFAVEMTTAIVTCNTCGATDAVGTLYVFRGAGIVMRCPHCDNALVTIVKDGTRADRLRRSPRAASHRLVSEAPPTNSSPRAGDVVRA